MLLLLECLQLQDTLKFGILKRGSIQPSTYVAGPSGRQHASLPTHPHTHEPGPGWAPSVCRMHSWLGQAGSSKKSLLPPCPTAAALPGPGLVLTACTSYSWPGLPPAGPAGTRGAQRCPPCQCAAARRTRETVVSIRWNQGCPKMPSMSILCRAVRSRETAVSKAELGCLLKFPSMAMHRKQKGGGDRTPPEHVRPVTSGPLRPGLVV